MSFKFNWGHGIFLTLTLFVLFISSFVYKTLFKHEYEHSLVSEEYYKEEIHYQKEIDRLNNAAALSQNVVVNTTPKGIELIFPSTFDFNKITANFTLQRIANKDFDLEKDIKLDSLTYLIHDKQLIQGMYSLKLNWEYKGEQYQLRDKISY